MVWLPAQFFCKILASVVPTLGFHEQSNPEPLGCEANQLIITLYELEVRLRQS